MTLSDLKRQYEDATGKKFFKPASSRNEPIRSFTSLELANHNTFLKLWLPDPKRFIVQVFPQVCSVRYIAILDF